MEHTYEGSTLLAGRKLLLADDSVAIQKVVDLTFTDEGMEVTAVGDGQQALEKLEQLVPDVVLADVFMPGVSGYALCEFIKQSERFRGIPVILLIGSFEPFDEAEARRVGVDEVVTKPFQSIRQLVNRVGSLLGGKPAGGEGDGHGHSTLGLGHSDDSTTTAAGPDSGTPPNVTVLVEAPMMDDLDTEDLAGHACSTDIETQTANTMELPAVDQQTPDHAEPSPEALEDTIEIEPPIDTGETEASSATSPSYANSNEMYLGAREMIDTSSRPIRKPETSPEFTGAFLDLGDFRSPAPAASGEDSILDLVGNTELVISEPAFPEAPQSNAGAFVVADAAVEHVFEEVEIIPAPVERAEMPSASVEEISEPAHADGGLAGTTPRQINLADVSPDVIDAIARRVVEQLSEKVVREIAWEVVPELSELLIKKKLDEKE